MNAEHSQSANSNDQRLLAPKGGRYDVSAQINGVSKQDSASKDRRQLKRRRVACSHCRQAKTRCDGADSDDKPCNRCAELSRECIVDTDYKRVNKRIKLHELQEQVKQLQSQAQFGLNVYVAAESDNTVTHSPSVSHLNIQQSSPRAERPRPSLSSDSGTHAFESSENGDGTHSQQTVSVLAGQDVMTPATVIPPSDGQTLENVSLDADQIASLFQAYFEHYHPLFPIVDVMTPNDLYAASPLLFWTVTLIGARKYDDDISLMSALLPPAISLLCMWPFPTSSMSTDVSYTLAGIAISSAIHIGLHRPELLQDYSRTKWQPSPQELREAVTVWSACYIAAESVTSSIGQDPYFETDRTIERVSQFFNPFNLPSALHCLLLIQKFCSRVHLLMRGECDGERTIRMKLMEQDLEILTKHVTERQSELNAIPPESSIYIDMLLLSARLQLQTYHLFDDSDTLVRKQGVTDAYKTALTLIMNLPSGDGRKFQVKHLPGTFIFMCYLAAIVVMKVANSSYSHYVNTENAKQAFNIVICMSRDCCVEDNDLMGRMSKILAQLWNVHRSLATERERPPSLKIKSRSLYSIVHDSLWLWRERFGGQAGNGAPSIQSVIVTKRRPASAEDTGPTPSSSSLSTSRDVLSTTLDAEKSSQAVEPSPNPPDHTDSNFMLNTFGGSQEQEDWMWNIGLPSLSGMDLDMISSHYNMSYALHDQL